MIRIGIVGAGAIGNAHKIGIERNPDCVLSAVCDLDIEKAKKIASGTEAMVCTDYKNIKDVDAVILNLPHFLHKDVSIYFLSRGIAVLVEKPMAMNVSECDEMIEVAKKYNTLFAVGHVRKYFPSIRKVKELVDTGEIGKLCHITETRNIDYFTNRPQWFLEKSKAGAGIVMNYGAHALDVIHYVTGDKVTGVFATANNFLNDCDIEASVQVSMKLSGGVGACFTFSAGKVPNQYDLYFYFTNGVAKITDGIYLYISKEGGEYTLCNLDYEADHMCAQIDELAKFLKGEESELVTPEYAREIIKVLQMATEQF